MAVRITAYLDAVPEAMFRTPRLFARWFRPDDLDDFAALCADPQVMRYVDDGTTLDRAGVARWIEVCQRKYADRGYGTSGVFERESGDFVGYCGVVRAPGRDFDELIYVLNRRFWGRGYAAEIGGAMLDHVFAISSLDEVAATIHPANLPSRRVAARMGMVERPDRAPADADGTMYYVVTRAQRATAVGPS